jgi:fructokinase
MFLVCGEALFDIFVRGSEGAELALGAVAGGSPFNVALGLTRLGQRAEFFTGLSRDLMGRKLAHIIAAEGIGVSYAVDVPRPTALSIVELGPDGSPDYAFYGDAPAYGALTPDIGRRCRTISARSMSARSPRCWSRPPPPLPPLSSKRPDAG